MNEIKYYTGFSLGEEVVFKIPSTSEGREVTKLGRVVGWNESSYTLFIVSPDRLSHSSEDYDYEVHIYNVYNNNDVQVGQLGPADMFNKWYIPAG